MGRPPQCHCHCDEPSSSTSSSRPSSSLLSSSSSSSTFEIIQSCLSDCPDGLAKCWEFTIAGVTGNSLCVDWNRTYVLTMGTNPLFPCRGVGQYEALSNFVRYSEGGSRCQVSDAYGITAVFDVGVTSPATGNLSNLRLSYGPYTQIDYRSLVAIDCMKPNVLKKFQSIIEINNCCSNWPEFITIEPVSCPESV